MINNHSDFQSAQFLYNNYSVFMNKNKLLSLLSNPNININYQRKDLEEMSSIELRTTLNNIILKNYINETVIKAQFTKKVLFKFKNSTCIYELPVQSSRIDICRFKGPFGNSIGYEIKTDLDNLDRLDKQLDDYSKVFDEVYVICSNNRVNYIEAILPPHIGIYVYKTSNKNITFTKYRKSSNRNCLEPSIMLKCIPKMEFYNLFNIKKHDVLHREFIENDILSRYTEKTISNRFKNHLISKYHNNWLFLKEHNDIILEIDYQWFYKNNTQPTLIYK